MENRNHSYDEEFHDDDSHHNSAGVTNGQISVEQLQRLVHLLDESDVSEIELKRVQEGTRLVLRKARASETSAQASPLLASQLAQMGQISQMPQMSMNGNAGIVANAEPAPTVDTKHRIVAPLVGIFHVWARPKGGALVAAGDKVKAGQLVGTIQSLNVMNEVETQYAGRVVEILVQEGQPVEYGQHLMTIDSAE